MIKSTLDNMVKETKTLHVAEYEKDTIIEKYQQFGWELINTRTIPKTKKVELAFSRDTTIPHYDVLASFQCEYDNNLELIRKPKCLQPLKFFGLFLILLASLLLIFNKIYGVDFIATLAGDTTTWAREAMSQSLDAFFSAEGLKENFVFIVSSIVSLIFFIFVLVVISKIEKVIEAENKRRTNKRKDIYSRTIKIPK